MQPIMYRLIGQEVCLLEFEMRELELLDLLPLMLCMLTLTQ